MSREGDSPAELRSVTAVAGAAAASERALLGGTALVFLCEEFFLGDDAGVIPLLEGGFAVQEEQEPQKGGGSHVEHTESWKEVMKSRN